MPRIRSVKPEYPQHRKVRKVSRDARLLNIHLWNLADDEGRLQELVPWIIGAIFPGDEDVVPEVLRGWLEELHEVGLIVRYEVDGENYIQCHDWDDHQRINKPSRSVLPPFQADSGRLPESSRNAPGTLPEDSRGEGKGRDKEEEGKGSAREADSAPPAWANICQALDRVAFTRDLTSPNPKAVAKVCEEFAVFDLDHLVGKFEHYWTEGPGAKKAFPQKDVVWAWRLWLEREDPDRTPRRPAPKSDLSAYSRIEAAA